MIHFFEKEQFYDEWIDFKSPRIKPFRTITIEDEKSKYLSPSLRETIFERMDEEEMSEKVDIEILIGKISN